MNKIQRPVVEIKSKRLNASNWRYFVVKFADVAFNYPDMECSEITDLRAASNLTEHSLRLNPNFFPWAKSSDFTSDWEYFSRIANDETQNIITCDQAYLDDLEFLLLKAPVIGLKTS